jgi:hypothetical protein
MLKVKSENVVRNFKVRCLKRSDVMRFNHDVAPICTARPFQGRRGKDLQTISGLGVARRDKAACF